MDDKLLKRRLVHIVAVAIAALYHSFIANVLKFKAQQNLNAYALLCVLSPFSHDLIRLIKISTVFAYMCAV